jgi:hypothetical protein
VDPLRQSPSIAARRRRRRLPPSPECEPPSDRLAREETSA